ncbi:hypothetical protein ABC382_00315 [Lysinibacillus sp. 1P01SD]|uniref:hypothetical protein n=1 Tax=Lysinibacillus sp. 1P01SD TaxID=3132285 RepID=UPI00399FFC97
MDEKKYFTNSHKDDFLKDIAKIMRKEPVPVIRKIEKVFAHVEASHFLTEKKEMAIYEPTDDVIKKLTVEGLKIVSFGKYLNLLEAELLLLKNRQCNEKIKVHSTVIEEIINCISNHKNKAY